MQGEFFHQNFRKWSLGNGRNSWIDQGCSLTYMVVRLSNKMGKNAFLVFFAQKWPFSGQPDNYIGWATSLAYSWVSSTYLRTISCNFGEKMFRIGEFEKLPFLKQQNSNIQNSKKLKIFCSIPVQISHKFLGNMDRIQSLWLLWFPAKK